MAIIEFADIDKQIWIEAIQVRIIVVNLLGVWKRTTLILFC